MTIAKARYIIKFQQMKKIFPCLTAALPLLLASCATAPRPQVFHNTDNSALVVASLDQGTCQVLAPTHIEREPSGVLLDQAKSFASHQTAIVILNNYSEPELGREFRDRSMGWFMGLRAVGYQHIVFLKGNGTTDPNGLLSLAEY